MKDFEKILNEVLKRREENQNAIDEVAEEIIEKALSYFDNPNITAVFINYINNQEIIVTTAELVEEFSHLIQGSLVYEKIKEILNSEDERTIEIKRKLKFYVPEPQNFITSIRIDLKND